MSIQQGTVDLSSVIQWHQSGLAFGPDGFRTTIRGTGQRSILDAEAIALQADGWEGSVDPGEGPNASITATISTLDPDNPDSNLITRWGLDVQWSDVPAANSQAFRNYIIANSGFDGATYRGIVAAAEQYRTEGTWTLYDALGSTDKAWAYDIINGETVREPDAILRRMNSYSPNTSLTCDWVDVGKVFTTSQINALTDAPNAIVGTLPSTYWLKTSAGADYASDGRFEVTTLWVSGTVARYPSHRYTYKT